MNWFDTKEPMKTFVTYFTDPQKRQCIVDWMEFQREGMIGDCELRKQAEIYSESIKLSKSYIVRTMNDIIMHIFEFYANLYFENEMYIIRPKDK